MKNNKTRTLCEAAIFIAMAEILSFIKLYEFPNGGSVTLEMLPIILFAVRYGCGWGAGAGFVFGTVTYLIGNKFSIDWTTIICDYFLAFTALGFGAGLLARRKWSVFYGTVIGGVLRFLAHYLIGAQNSERLQLPCKILIPAADSGVVVSAGVAHGKPPFLQVTKKAALRLLS